MTKKQKQPQIIPSPDYIITWEISQYNIQLQDNTYKNPKMCPLCSSQIVYVDNPKSMKRYYTDENNKVCSECLSVSVVYFPHMVGIDVKDWIVFVNELEETQCLYEGHHLEFSGLERCKATLNQFYEINKE